MANITVTVTFNLTSGATSVATVQSNASGTEVYAKKPAESKPAIDPASKQVYSILPGFFNLVDLFTNVCTLIDSTQNFDAHR